MIKNYLPLIDGLIDAFFFLESSGPNEVDPDSAGRCLENMSASLLTLDRSDQIELRSHLEKIAEGSDKQWYRDFVQKLPDAIGLASPERKI